MASSTELCPAIIFPSKGILCPGFTMTISLISTSSIAISTSCPSLRTVAVDGMSFINFSIASEVFCFERDSKYFPTEINVKIIPADS